ncbi:MAG TPA: putative beta-lysine N-acetyltransferase, partial [Paenibacillaceae bacterium]|nr:putative beta-lysine N-acetyltransferase [Paenibacillaceae bacterium]
MSELKYYMNSTISGSDFIMKVCLDWYSLRLRVDDYRGNIYAIIKEINRLAKKNFFTKSFVKVRSEHWRSFLSRGFMVEGVYSGYFRGSDAYCMSFYYDERRRISNQWKKEDEILQRVLRLSIQTDKPLLPDSFVLRKATSEDASILSRLYGSIFVSYPTPVHDPAYLSSVMEEGSLFYIVEKEGQIVSAASAEINYTDYNAEMTDCVTLPQFRGHGFMRLLIYVLGEKLKDQRIYNLYSLARSQSFGMNAALHQ